MAYRFFLGLSLEDLARDPHLDGEKHHQRRLLMQEVLAHGDKAFLNLKDHYLSTPRKAVAIFRWGVEQCGAYWVLRSNDDVFLRLAPTLKVRK